jgi:hypothetical protein
VTGLAVQNKLEGLLLFILVAFAVLFLWVTKDYGATAALFPRVVAVVSLGFVALDLFGQFSRRRKKSATPRASSSVTSSGVFWFSALVLQAVYIGLIYVAGFSAATLTYLIVSPRHLRFRNWTAIIVHGVLLTVTIVYTFHSIFHVRMPKGMLGIPW